MSKKDVPLYGTTGSRATRSEYNDGLMRDNVRIDNKHKKELKVHERAKNVVSRTFDKESQLFKQKQALQKKRSGSLNSQGHRIRMSNTHPALQAQEYHPNLQPSPNGTLSPPISDTHSSENKSPVTPITPGGDNHQFQYSPDLIDQDATDSQPSPEVLPRKEPSSPTRVKARSLSENSRVIIPHRLLSRSSLTDDPDFVGKNRATSAARGVFMDQTGRLREQTVFDFLSKPKHNYELQKRKDIRVQLEKEFNTVKPAAKKSVPINSKGKKSEIK